MEDDRPPQLSVAAEQSQAERDKQRRLDDLNWPTREMVANLLRVLRGAGRPHELPQQIIDLAGVILEANEVSNAWGIWSRIEEVLQSAWPDRWEEISDDRPFTTVARGSLQALASNLVYQSTQRIRGEHEIADGFRERDREIERRRERALSAEAEARAQRYAEAARKRAATKARKAKLPAKRAETDKAMSEPIEKREGESTADFMRRAALPKATI